MASKYDKINLLGRFATVHPDGFTYIDIKDELGWQRTEFFRVVRAFRIVFAGKTINLVCDPQRLREPWRYRLVGNYEGAEEWITNRLGDMESRLVTIKSVTETIGNSVDSRTRNGRKANKIYRTLVYLLGELQEINANNQR